MRIDCGISEAVLTTAEGVSKEHIFESIRRECDDLKRDILSDQRVTKADFSEYTEAGLHHFRTDIKVRDYRILNDLVKKLDARNKPAKGSNFRIERLESGKIIYSETFEFSKEELEARSHQTDDPWQIAGQLLANSVLADYYISLKLHAPKITSCNGKLDDSMQNVEWKISMAEIASTKSPRDFKAEVEMPVTFALQAKAKGVLETVKKQEDFEIWKPLVVVGVLVVSLIYLKLK
jgi:hypothetical protein